jgi:hypothetical protein
LKLMGGGRLPAEVVVGVGEGSLGEADEGPSAVQGYFQARQILAEMFQADVAFPGFSAFHPGYQDSKLSREKEVFSMSIPLPDHLPKSGMTPNSCVFFSQAPVLKSLYVRPAQHN